MDNALIVPSGDIGSWNGSAYTGIAGYIASGRGDGSWNGSGVVTSMSSALAPQVLTTLDAARAGDVGLTTFHGFSLAPGDVLVRYTWGGDANLDGTLNGDDYFRIDSHVAQNGAVFGYVNGDFNYDGAIDGDDYFIIDSNIAVGQTATPFPPVGL